MPGRRSCCEDFVDHPRPTPSRLLVKTSSTRCSSPARPAPSSGSRRKSAPPSTPPARSGSSSRTICSTARTALRGLLRHGRAAGHRRPPRLRRAGRRRFLPAPPLRRRCRPGLRLHRPLPQTLRRGRDESTVWAPSLSTLVFAAKEYKECKEDIDAAFIVRDRMFLSKEGRLGAIINRTQLTKTTLEKWRLSNLLSTHIIHECADLGLGVLDGALVETAAYSLASKSPGLPSFFFRLGTSENRESDLLAVVKSPTTTREGQVFAADCSLFSALPASRIAYWTTPTIRRILAAFPRLEGNYATARQGTITSDNFDFYVSTQKWRPTL